ncbi:MarR family winged helix-turn-helix transcriptional regulator [Oharaeibacter diazotrophicus]|uniref:DNA-binding MarR family transcriptional regulator n=1 Tax=Oharaeibacter diazotrophicus TaxID=1920512 RepID=A0A4R6R546_9HYPH|nr:MarR family transcriptional regulator [Oharaeibacter diazotrophicus]TDP80929.1 DNA-binding MarR family transcriptional regulator [Oharaeibacter diazotrophicus]BBE73824.1 transcriptional regulator SlyA [Pleomorphomonas sp. SM30]GLS74692.1 MarR family transcriptional regulator [Oharaeibacter diazotrophicus]
MPASEETLGFLVVDVARLFRHRFETALAAAGLGVTPGEARTLHHLAAAGPMRQSLLAQRLGVEPMTLVGFLDRLERAGLIARDPDPDDRRAKRIVLTDAAEAVLPTIRTVAAGVRAAATTGLDGDEVAALRRALARMRANLVSPEGAR